MLVGKNVRIRPLEKADLQLFYEWMGNKENVGDYMDSHLVNKDSFIERMEGLLKDRSKLYTMLEDSGGKPIGVMNYREVPGSASTVEIGILIAESSARGKGFGGECLALFVDYIFNTQNVMRIQFLTQVDNLGMRQIGEKNGFTLEGVLKKYKLTQGLYRDYCIMAITREDWATRGVDQ